MVKKHPILKRPSLPRSLSVSLAGLRAGGALAVDGAVQRLMGRGAGEGSDFARREARRFVGELGKLKGTYVKIGQMLALFGEHFLPPVLTDALHDLEDQTEPLHWDAVESAMRHGLGPELFRELDIEPEAVAAASLAQVHLAKVRATGEWICLKLQYPGLADVIDADFDTVVRMLLVARWIQAGRDLDDWMESMRSHLHNEIDYGREAAMTRQMAQLVDTIGASVVPYRVPQLHERYCTDTVMAMEYIEGHPITHPDVSRLSLQRRNALAQGMLQLFFIELYDWGVLQTDPNFGNYLLCLDDRRRIQGQDTLALLDFGSVLECDEDFLFHLRQTIAAGLEQDVPTVVDGLIGLGCLQPDASQEGRQLFADFCLQLLEPLRPPAQLPQEYLNSSGQYRWSQSHLMRRAGKQAALSAAGRHFTTPSRDFALIARKLTGVFTFIAVLEAEFNGHQLADSYIKRWRAREPRGRG